MREKIISRKNLLILAGIITVFSEGLRSVLFDIPIVHVGNAIILALFAEIVVSKTIGIFKRKEKFRINSETRTLWALIAVFILAGSISALAYKPGFLLYFWSVRNYLRFFALFLDCIYIFDCDSEKAFYKILDIIVVLHIILTLVQFFVLGVRWDYLNGIFGTSMGGNSGVNALLLINTCVCLYKYYQRKLKWHTLIFHISWMLFNAAIAEIKVYFAEIVCIMFAYTVFSMDVRRILKLLSAIFVIYIVAVFLMFSIYPHTLQDLTNVQTVCTLATPHHDNADSLSRKTQFSGMTQPILSYAHSIIQNSGITALFTGLGFGNAEYGTKEIFISSFYTANERLWYFDFLIPFLYAETGIIGLVIYNSMWIFMGIMGVIDYRRNKSEAGLLQIMFSVSVMILALYDVTLRNNYGYIMWAAIAVPFILKREIVTEADFERVNSSNERAVLVTADK